MAKHVTVICRVKGQTVIRLTDRIDSVDDIVFYTDTTDESSSDRSHPLDLNRIKTETVEPTDSVVDDQLDNSNDSYRSDNSGDHSSQTLPFGSNYRWRGELNYGSISDYQSMDSYKKYMSIIKTVGRQLFVCTYQNCRYQSLWKNAIVNHIRTSHLSFYPFICGFPGCGKCFAIRSNLNNHRKVHSGRSVLSRSRELADSLYNYSHYNLVDDNMVLSQNRISLKMKTFGQNKNSKQQNTIEHNERQTFDTISSERNTNETNDKREEEMKIVPTNAIKSIGDSHSNGRQSKARKSMPGRPKKQKPTPAFVGIKSVEHYIENFQRNGKTWRKCLFGDCDYSTHYPTSIVYHIRNQHLNDKPYVCDCGKSFAMKTNYNNHQKTHKNSRLTKY